MYEHRQASRPAPAAKGIWFMLLAAACAPVFAQSGATVNLSGIVTDSLNAPIAAAAIKLENNGLTAVTGADGRFTLASGTSVLNERPRSSIAAIHDGSLFLSLPEVSRVKITAYGIDGMQVASMERLVDVGSHALKVPHIGFGIRFIKVEAGPYVNVLKAIAVEGALKGSAIGPHDRVPAALARQAASSPFYDVITATKAGYLKGYLSVSASSAGDLKIKMLKEGAPKFSFFVTSMRGLQALANDTDGFGGDLRFGEVGQGAGLRGADKICAALAEKSMPGSTVKGWRAFLSVTADTYGKQVNAIDRIGEGPWYDRTGRVLAPKKSDLLAVRPQNGDATIQNDLPNEYGIPNHRPDPTKPQEDNHHMITGSSATGTLKSATSTCKDWTTADGSSANGKPSAGFAWPRGGGGGGGNSGSNWMTTWDAPGCAAGIEIVEAGGAPQGSIIIGGGGGYGGFYCFALNP
jgi:hypothetical protein